MGFGSFFGNLINGAKDVASWAINNSGDIAGVVNSIAQVATKGGEDDPDAPDIPPHDTTRKLIGNFDKASKVLIKISREQLPPAPTNLGPGTISNVHTVCGMWSKPASLNPQHLPDRAIYHDLAKYCSITGVPLTIGGTSATSAPWDTAYMLAEGLFADSPPPFPATHPITHPSTKIENYDKTCVIHACHAYYQVPLGKGGPDSGWHGAITMRLTTTSTFRATQAADLARFTILNLSPTTPPPTTDVWIVTLTIRWGSAPIAVTLVPPFLTYMKQNHADYGIQFNSLTGTLETIKIVAPPGVSPAMVKSTLEAASQAVTNAKMASQAAGGKLDTPPIPPTVMVSNSSIQTSTSAGLRG